ncbi:MAG: hypothetical protein JNN10_07650 [Sphingopyxis sp.]|uniref:hypothetical protein n=1 Tax=Sphingopyxis sp. TaxID=1908224 RepID=UPI001A4F5133|nr:hypothetical protein [Sphingopyxis sp.]MBL9066151.1 hypothetical protein [Sphingopyxis sp.]
MPNDPEQNGYREEAYQQERQEGVPNVDQAIIRCDPGNFLILHSDFFLALCRFPRSGGAKPDVTGCRIFIERDRQLVTALFPKLSG